MSSHLLKADHSNTAPYAEGNLLPLPTEGTDAYSVHTFESLPTHPGGFGIQCPTVKRTLTVLTDGAYVGTNIWTLTTAWDANVTFLPVMFSYNTMLIHSVVTANRTYTTPTAALLLTHILAHTDKPLFSGSMWCFFVGVDGGNLNFTAGAGCTIRGNTTLAQCVAGTTRRAAVRLTNVTPGAEAYEFYIF